MEMSSEFETEKEMRREREIEKGPGGALER